MLCRINDVNGKVKEVENIVDARIYVHDVLMQQKEGTKMSIDCIAENGNVARLTYSYVADPGYLKREALVRVS